MSRKTTRHEDTPEPGASSSDQDSETRIYSLEEIAEYARDRAILAVREIGSQGAVKQRRTAKK